MRRPASRESSGDDAQASALIDAARRLEAALARLEGVVKERPAAHLGAVERDATERLAETIRALEQERAELAERLDRARDRERNLEQAAAAASQALGRAMAEVRATLGNDESGEDAEASDVQGRDPEVDVVRDDGEAA